jgi:hypothetical protein
VGIGAKRKPSTWAKKARLRQKLLGESPTKARGRLIKLLLLRLFEDAAGLAYCFRCGDEILGLDFHLDHKEPWQRADDPVRFYFDTENVQLSHASCNSSAHRNYNKNRAGNLTPEERVIRHRAANRKWKLKKKLLAARG